MKEQTAQLVHIVGQVPEANKQILDYLFSFLKKVANNEEHNKMGAMNLAILFAPNLMRPKIESVDNMMNPAATEFVLRCIESWETLHKGPQDGWWKNNQQTQFVDPTNTSAKLSKIIIKSCSLIFNTVIPTFF